MDNSSKFSITA